MTTENIKTLAANVNLTLAPGKPSEDWPNANNYRATLAYQGRRMTVDFHTGSGWKEDPTSADVLDCLLTDADTANESFEDWCSNFGWDTDSRKAERTYKACKSIRVRLEKLLGDDFERFMYAERM